MTSRQPGWLVVWVKMERSETNHNQSVISTVLSVARIGDKSGTGALSIQEPRVASQKSVGRGPLHPLDRGCAGSLPSGNPTDRTPGNSGSLRRPSRHWRLRESVREDLKQAATIMAAFLCHAATMDEKLPRKPFDPRRGICLALMGRARRILANCQHPFRLLFLPAQGCRREPSRRHCRT